MSDRSVQDPGTAPQAGTTSSGSDTIPSPLEAVPDMRAAARWTIGAVAAVGALLVGGGSLTAVGRIDDAGDLVAFASGMLIVIVAVGWAVWQTAEALTPPLTTIETLQDKRMSDLRIQIARSPFTYYGPFGHSWGELSGELRRHLEIAENLRSAHANETDPSRRTQWAAALAAAEANIALAKHLQTRLLSLIHVWRIRSAVRRARLHTLIAMLLATAGAILLLTATTDNPIPGAPPTLRSSADPDLRATERQASYADSGYRLPALEHTTEADGPSALR